jgi:hypothetical protein
MLAFISLLEISAFSSPPATEPPFLDAVVLPSYLRATEAWSSGSTFDWSSPFIGEIFSAW